MLVSKDSPLRRLPSRMPTKQVLYLDGIRYCIEIIDLAYHRLEKTLGKIASRPSGSEELAPLIVKATADAWMIVDSIHRLRRLIEHTPGIKKKLPEVQIFLRNCAKFEVIRNFVQHFPTEIQEFVQRRMALWGVISWTRKSEETGESFVYSIAPGTFFGGAHIPTAIFDTQEGRFLNSLILHAGPTSVDLADIYRRTVIFWNWFEDCCNQVFTEDSRHGADVFAAFNLQPVIGKKDPSDPNTSGL